MIELYCVRQAFGARVRDDISEMYVIVVFVKSYITCICMMYQLAVFVWNANRFIVAKCAENEWAAARANKNNEEILIFPPRESIEFDFGRTREETKYFFMAMKAISKSR